MQGEKRCRARDIGITIGNLSPGRWNAITDVPGVRVGYTTLISGSGPLATGKGPVRTGVTAIIPRDGLYENPVFAGYHQLNGSGEMTGIAWIEESGLLAAPIALTNTHSVGVVRDAIIAHDLSRWAGDGTMPWRLPVVTETSDLWLNDMNGFHVKPEHLFAAVEGASSGQIAEGCVGGGTGAICHEFKGGTGTSSRMLPEAEGGWTVGVLVQANYGWRPHLQIDGIPVGREIPTSEVPSPRTPRSADGSIVAIVATDAPLLPLQCKRLAQRATIGIARTGGNGDNGSGDLFLAFSTANSGLNPRGFHRPVDVKMLPNDAISRLFEAVAEATQEAIINALCMATTMTGANDRVVHAIPLDRLGEIVRKHRRSGIG